TYGELHARLKRLTERQRLRELDELVGEPRPDDGANFGRPMTLDELRAFDAMPRMSIGAHTLSHPSLAMLDEAEQLRELSDARKALVEAAHADISTVAYPFGKEADFGSRTRALAAQAGYVAAFTTIAKPVKRNCDAFALPRLTVHEWPAAEFAARLRMA